MHALYTSILKTSKIFNAEPKKQKTKPSLPLVTKKKPKKAKKKEEEEGKKIPKSHHYFLLADNTFLKPPNPQFNLSLS